MSIFLNSNRTILDQNPFSPFITFWRIEAVTVSSTHPLSQCWQVMMSFFLSDLAISSRYHPHIKRVRVGDGVRTVKKTRQLLDAMRWLTGPRCRAIFLVLLEFLNTK